MSFNASFYVKLCTSGKLLRLLHPVVRSKSSLADCYELDHSDVTLVRKSELGVSYSNVNFDETRYYFQDGLRKVYPYYFTYHAFCKPRWSGKKLVHTYTNEFVVPTTESVEERIANGQLRVNGRIVPLDYSLKDSDLITNAVHRHEMATLGAPVKIIKDDGEVVVVEKPPSVPVHPCGAFRHNSLLFILAKEHNLKGLHVVNRLDRLTSGVLLLAKNKEKAREVQAELALRKIRKEYICRVEGHFPDGIITCNKPLQMVKGKVSFVLAANKGRASITEFERISYNGNSSVVICRPLTGRTHQIRVHLQYLGHPIVNDPVYNSYDFGPTKGAGGLQDKSIEEVSQALLESRIPSLTQNPEKTVNPLQAAVINSYCNTSEYLKLAKLYTKDEKMFQLDAKCRYCSSSFKDPIHTDMVICLHALRYKGNGWDYGTEMPEWAKSDWDII